jgi:hypothetical protein
MDTSSALIQLLLSLLSDPKVAQDFQKDPAGYLASCGLASVTPEQVHDAATLVADHHTPKPHHGGGEHHHPQPAPAPEHHETTVKYLQSIITNNYIDDRDTTVDNSIHQTIHADGDVNQHFDTTTTLATGDGSVAANGAITGSTVTTGDGNVLGNGNQVGDGNTAAYGAGSTANHAAFGDPTVSDGSGLSVAGPASGTDATSGSFNHATQTTDDSTHIDGSFTNESTTDVSNTVDSHNHTATDSFNHTDVASHNAADIAVG